MGLDSAMESVFDDEEHSFGERSAESHKQSDLSSSSTDSFKEAMSLHSTPPPVAMAMKHYQPDDFDDFVSATQEMEIQEEEPVTLAQLKEIAARYAPAYDPDLILSLKSQQEVMLRETEREIFEDRIRLSRKTSLNYHTFNVYQQALQELQQSQI